MLLDATGLMSAVETESAGMSKPKMDCAGAKLVADTRTAGLGEVAVLADSVGLLATEGRFDVPVARRAHDSMKEPFSTEPLMRLSRKLVAPLETEREGWKALDWLLGAKEEERFKGCVKEVMQL